MRFDTCASPTEAGTYGIKDLHTGQIWDLQETMGIAQQVADIKNGVGDPNTEVAEWAEKL